MSKPDTRVRCLVSGRVQGVFFRAATAERAAELGLRGSATNLPNGDVEVIAAGAPEAVGALAEWLWQGSPASRVDAVTVSVYDRDVGSGFHTV